MIAEADPETTEHQRRIDALPADVFAFLSDPETVPEYWPGATATDGGDSSEVACPVASSSGASTTPPVEVRVIEATEPAALTMRLDGPLYGTVEWTLQPHEGSTLVTATTTLGIDADAFDAVGSVVGESDRAEGQPLASVEDRVEATFEEALDTLRTRCERRPPPAGMADFERPDVYCPFPAEVNPHHEEVSDRSVAWAREMGLLERGEVPPGITAALRFACRVHPTAPREAFRLLSDWYCWGFLEDDTRDESALSERPREMVEYQEPLLAILDGEEPDRPRTPLVRAFADLRRRWTELGTPEWRERFERHHVEYFAAHRWEARNHARNHVPVRPDYVRNKRVAAGLYVVFDLAALAGDVDRPASLYRSPIYQDLLEAAANVVCWTNDVFSLRKELAHGDVNNLVVVVRSEQGCSVRAAVTEVCDLIAAETRRFEELRRRLVEEFDAVDDLDRHLTDLEKALGGHLAYSEEVARYASGE